MKWLFALALFLFSSLQSSIAQDPTPLKPGLWKTTMNMFNGSDTPFHSMDILQCVGPSSQFSSLKGLNRLSESVEEECEVTQESQGDARVTRTICKGLGGHSQSEQLLQGDPNVQLNFRINTTYDPEVMPSSRVTGELIWSGPCKEGMKPGEAYTEIAGTMMKIPSF